MKDKKKSIKNKKEQIQKKIDIHYLKTKNYRTFHVDGAFGGITPNGKIYTELYIQRYPTPKIVTHEIKNNLVVGDEIKREGKEGIVREIEAGMIMDVEVAKVLRDWLTKKIDLYEKTFGGENDNIH